MKPGSHDECAYQSCATVVVSNVGVVLASSPPALEGTSQFQSPIALGKQPPHSIAKRYQKLFRLAHKPTFLLVDVVRHPISVPDSSKAVERAHLSSRVHDSFRTEFFDTGSNTITSKRAVHVCHDPTALFV